MLLITPCVDAVKAFMRFSEKNKLLLIFMLLAGLSMTLTYKAGIFVLRSYDRNSNEKDEQIEKLTKRLDDSDAGKVEWMMKYIECRDGNSKIDTMIFYLKHPKNEKSN